MSGWLLGLCYCKQCAQSARLSFCKKTRMQIFFAGILTQTLLGITPGLIFFWASARLLAKKNLWGRVPIYRRYTHLRPHPVPMRKLNMNHDANCSWWNSSTNSYLGQTRSAWIRTTPLWASFALCVKSTAKMWNSAVMDGHAGLQMYPLEPCWSTQPVMFLSVTLGLCVCVCQSLKAGGSRVDFDSKKSLPAKWLEM